MSDSRTDLVTLLVDRGVVGIGASREDHSCSHEVAILADGDRRVVAKRAPAAVRAEGRDLGAEAAALRLAAAVPALRGLAPRLHLADRDAHVIVTDHIAGVPADALLVGVDRTVDPRVAGILGAGAGRWHAGTAGAPFPVRAVPWPLRFGADPSYALEVTPGAGGRVLASVADDPSLRAVLADLGQAWTPSAVIHGDLKAANALVATARATKGASVVTFVDWELAGIGDPAWDLGCLLAEIVAAGSPSTAHAAAAACIAAHRAAGAERAGWTGDPAAFAHRIALSTIARLCAIAFETAAAAGAVNDDVAGTLASARAAARDLRSGAAEVARWAA